MSTTSTPAQLRYTIKPALYAMTEVDRLRIKRRIMARCNISESSFSRYINLKTDDAADIPALVLLEFAVALNVEAETLLTATAQRPAA